ncbi:MAG: ParB/RepB/Spo0J family partition protein, partial [Succinivibrio sp.]
MSTNDFDVADFLSNNPLARQILSDEEDSKKSDINKAIDSICAISSEPANEPVTEISIDDIEVHGQVRKYFDETELLELTESIKENGLLSPITVCETEDGKYRLICGERRYRACKKLGLSSIKANIFKLEAKEGISVNSQITVLQIIENLQRSDPTLSDYVTAVSDLIAFDPQITKEKMAKLISKSIDYVSRLQEICKFTSREKDVFLPLGIKFLQNVYLPFKNTFPEEANVMLEKAENYLSEVDSRTSEVNEEIKKQVEQLYKRCKKNREKELNKVSAVTPKREKFAISLALLNRKKANLGDRLQKYLID